MVSSKDGYAFPMALAAIAIISLVIVAASTQLLRSNQIVIELGDQIAIETEAISAEQTLLYQMLTNPVGPAGIEVGGRTGIARQFQTRRPDQVDVALIPANGQPRQFGDVILRYIDQQGLINVATMNPDNITNMLEMLDVPMSRWSVLVATLQDYQDTDDQRRPNGAESREYPEDHRPPNRRLNSALELCSVEGWGELRICEDTGRLLLIAEARNLDTMNVRMVPSPILRLMDAREESSSRLQSRIDSGSATTFADIGHPQFDQTTDFLAPPSQPTASFVLITHDRRANYVWRTSFELSPESVTMPFSTKQRYRIEGAYVRDMLEVDQNNEIPPLPSAG